MSERNHEPPLVKGGQGRSPGEVISSALAVVLIVAVFIVCVVGVITLIGAMT